MEKQKDTIIPLFVIKSTEFSHLDSMILAELQEATGTNNYNPDIAKQFLFKLFVQAYDLIVPATQEKIRCIYSIIQEKNDEIAPIVDIQSYLTEEPEKEAYAKKYISILLRLFRNHTKDVLMFCDKQKMNNKEVIRITEEWMKQH